ncbi:TRAP transporter large permease [Oricola thermophila]|uniref:TRAP transporter large permease protein n=1 Tax=Oricola thermophila TaxID=2742145 RepID=A0A6N1VGZ2_9HYPH|nr:TRAP transporter large permease [Oricola thermophila]QKV20181.1 TRAP transporter large permease [Oricola thermophila]
MDSISVGALSFLALFALLLLSVPIGFAMGLCGLAGMALIIGPMPALSLFGTTVYETVVTYDLSIIPLFVLMGSVASRSGLSKELYGAFNAWFGAFRGGLALATIGACGAFAAICGSSVATAATMSQVALPEMQRYKYAESLSTGSVAAGGIIGILIPPSVVLVLYGVLTETSIGDLFIAGFLPGLLTIVGFMLVVALITRLHPDMGPVGERASARQKINALGRTWAILLLFLIVIGGIYVGIFTPTEAAGVGAVGAMGVSAMRRRLSYANLVDALMETVKTTAMIFTILIGALTLNNLMVFSGIAGTLSGYVAGLDMHPAAIMAAILVIYLVMGCFLDSLAMILLTVPIFFPIASNLGFDPVWFGVIVVMVVELGLITPPVGMNVFVIKGMAPDVKLTSIYAGVIPFVIAQMILIVLVFIFPEIALWLPETARAFQ